MSTYRMVWISVTAFVVGAASVYDVAGGGLVRMASLGVGFGAFGAFGAFALAEESLDRRAWVRRSTLWCGGAAMAADALVTTWDRAGATVGVVLLVASPSMVSFTGDRFEAWASSRRTSGPPDALSTRDLRRRWDWTTAEVLRPTTTVSRRLVLVEERRRLLDEMQLRDPVHFEAWLATAVPDRRRARPWSQDG
jgi:hypothetical protein